MLSLSKTKVSKEYIYTNKHSISIYSLEELNVRFKDSKNKISDITDFYLNDINFDKLRFIVKLASILDGKHELTASQIKMYLLQLINKAVENYLKNSMDGVYVSENLVVMVSPYGGKHYLSICPKIDFLK